MGIEDAKDHKMHVLLEAKEFLLIPPYQRRYSWEESQWKDLWTDIMKLNPDKSHFFGSIVFMRTKYKSQSVQELEVVDGQQRITTICIFLCAIRDYFKNKGKEHEQTVDSMNKYLYVRDNDGNIINHKLKLGNLDNPNYKMVIMGKNEEINDEEYNNVNEAYDFYYWQLEKLEPEKVKKIRDKILDNLIYVSIVVNEDIDVYRLFETMNNRGLSLSKVDLIKNYLFKMGLESEKLDQNETRDLWTKLVVNLDGIWDERFFRQFLMSSKKFKITEKISTRTMFDAVKKIIEKGCSVEEFLKEVVKESTLYHKLYYSKIDVFDKNWNDLVNQSLKDLKVNSETPFTFLLSIFRNPFEPKVIVKIIELTNSLLVRGRITDKRTSVLDYIFQHLAQNIHSQNDPVEYVSNYYKKSKYYADNESFEDQFSDAYFSTNDKTKYILDTIEEKHYGKDGKKIRNRYCVHIEHILPQQLFKRYKNWLEYANMTKKEHEDFNSVIGNLTLLERKPNISASNNPFKEKKKNYSKDKTEMLMTQELLEFDKWGESEIQERSKKLAKIAVKVWGL